MKTISPEADISEFLERIELTKNKFFVVCDENKNYFGVVTEGDLRRYLLTKHHLPKKVSDFYNKDGYFEFLEEQSEKDTKLFDTTKGFVPLLDSKNKFVDLKEIKNSVSQVDINSVSCIAPVRISFAGGGSDLEHWWSQHRGRVVNLAIDKYARVRVTKNYTNTVNINSINLRQKISCNVVSLSKYVDHDLSLIVRCLIGIGIDEGYDIEIFCDFNPGSGLGGSSSLVVCLLKAFSVLFRLNLTDRRLIQLSHQLERKHCKVEGGWQDFIPAVCGGLSVINFDHSGFKNYKLHISKTENEYINNCLFITPIGVSRSSSKIHEQQKAASSNKDYRINMKKIVEIADACVDLIGSHEIHKLGTILDRGWQFKKSLGSFISNELIDEHYNKMLGLGATGGRLLGAGGAGFLLLHVPLEKQALFLENTGLLNISVERIRVSEEGVRSIVNG